MQDSVFDPDGGRHPRRVSGSRQRAPSVHDYAGWRGDALALLDADMEQAILWETTHAEQSECGFVADRCT